jgi:hypothetical protein
MMTRREFAVGAVAAVGQLAAAPTTRPNVGQIDRERILRAARLVVAAPTTKQSGESAAFTAFSVSIAALAAASVVDGTNAEAYGAAAAGQLRAWLMTTATRLESAPEWTSAELAGALSGLGELAVAVPFLRLEDEVEEGVKDWFRKYLVWLTEARTALLARDAKDHVGSSWLLQAAAAAKLVGDEKALSELRHRFKAVTVRAQINAEGLFPHELPTENPLRNSLYNLDLLGGVCQLLSTQFESIWDHELQDGPGMRAAVAKHAYYIANKVKWPYPADVKGFGGLPYRRPALVFAGRAFGQAEYVTLWRGLNPDPVDAEQLRAFPIRQPVLWLPGARRASVV